LVNIDHKPDPKRYIISFKISESYSNFAHFKADCVATVRTEHYSRHRLTASVTMWLLAHRRQPMTNGLALLIHWLVRQVINRVSSATSLCMRL